MSKGSNYFRQVTTKDLIKLDKQGLFNLPRIFGFKVYQTSYRPVKRTLPAFLDLLKALFEVLVALVKELFKKITGAKGVNTKAPVKNHYAK